jgi:hypothetical protein
MTDPLYERLQQTLKALNLTILPSYLRVGHKSEQVKDWFYRTQRTIRDEIEQDNQVPGV